MKITYIGPRPNSKNDTYVITKTTEKAFPINPRRHSTKHTEERSMPPADTRMSVLLFVFSIKSKAA